MLAAVRVPEMEPRAHEFLLMPFTHSRILRLECAVQGRDLQERVQMSLEQQVLASLYPC